MKCYCLRSLEEVKCPPVSYGAYKALGGYCYFAVFSGNSWVLVSGLFVGDNLSVSTSLFCTILIFLMLNFPFGFWSVMWLVTYCKSLFKLSASKVLWELTFGVNCCRCILDFSLYCYEVLVLNFSKLVCSYPTDFSSSPVWKNLLAWELWYLEADTPCSFNIVSLTMTSSAFQFVSVSYYLLYGSLSLTQIFIIFSSQILNFIACRYVYQIISK